MAFCFVIIFVWLTINGINKRLSAAAAYSVNPTRHRAIASRRSSRNTALFWSTIVTEQSRKFNFDDFDERITQALAENAEQMGKLAARGLVVVPDSLMPEPPPEPPDQAA